MNAVRRRHREGTAAVESARSRGPVRARQAVPGMQSAGARVVRRDRRRADQRPAAITVALRALLIRSAGTVLMFIGSATAGAAIGALVLGVGITVTAWIAVGVSVLALIVGAVDYVRTHP